MNVKLVKLSYEYKELLEDMLSEWIAYNNENPEANTSPWAIFKNDYHDFDNYLENLELKVGTDQFVPDSTYFLLDLDKNIFVGAANIRHYLSKGLEITGGHIGDGIRPSCRHQGYGKILVKLALEKCRELRIEKVLMTCDKDNPASAGTIIANGGVFENEVEEDGNIEQRYWINLGLEEEKLSQYLNVRKLNQEDVKDIFALSITNPFYYEYCPPFVTKNSIMDDMRALPNNKEMEDKYYLGYFDEAGKLIAILDLIDKYPYSKSAFIGLLMVHNRYSKQGIGSLIVDELSDYLRSKHYVEIRLAWVKENSVASNFWQKNGFKPIFELKSDGDLNLVVANKLL